MNKKTISILAAVMMLSSCSAGPEQPALTEAPLAGARIGGDFTLTDQNGDLRSRSDFDGKWRMVYFGYTYCPDICTPDMQNLIAGLNLFAAQEPELAKQIQPIFITIDPERDTPDVLKQFTRAFSDNLIGLTGSEKAIADTAEKFAVTYAKVANGDSYLVNHTQTPFLMDPQGNPIAILPADRPQTQENEGRPEMVAEELAKWVR